MDWRHDIGGWKGGLRRGEDDLWHYRFRLKGALHEGNTGCPKIGDARAWVLAYKTSISKNEVGLKDCPTVTVAFESWVHTREQKQVSAAQIKRARQAVEPHILPVIGYKAADRVTTEDIGRIIDRYLNGFSNRPMDKGKHKPRTRHGANTVLLYLNAIFNYLKGEGYFRKLPYAYDMLTVREPHRAFVPIELEPQFFAAVDWPRNVPVMLAVRCMFWLGLRESEACEMRWEGLSWDLKRYTPGSTAFDQTKGKEAKGLPTEEGIRALLWAIIWMNHDGVKPLGGWVVPGKNGEPHKAQWTKKAILRGEVAIRIPGLTPHRMRAGLATNLARAGKGAHHIQKQLRHKDISTSESYVRIGTQDLEDGIDALKSKTGRG